MTDLQDQMATDATAVFLTDFAETVTYYPYDGTKPPRTISAVVDRMPPENPDPVERGPLDAMAITVANSETLGISSDELNLGGDEIKLARRIGETATARRIVRLVSHDRGMLVLELH